MSDIAPDSPAADRNLLFGILALQMDFIGREALIGAMNAWVLDKHKPLGRILVEQGALSPARRGLLEPLVEEHVRQHGGDPQRSLAALSSVGSVRKQLSQVADADVQASLAQVAAAGAVAPLPPTEDAYPTRRPAAEEGATGLRFRILRPHAKGGLGIVFVAHDGELHREVALKEIQVHHADREESRARFLLEAEVTGGLEHPGIVPVYGLGHYADGRPFYAMRLIKGDSLKEAIARFHEADRPGRDPGERTLALRELLRRFVDVCNAVAYAHSRGVLHRDLKPGNVMVGAYGETLVVDWGLAKVAGRTQGSATDEATLRPPSADSGTPTQIGSAIGTPSFMSPEQAAGRLDQLGPASDVYSLGATLYCLLTGKAPFDGRDAGEMLRKVQRGDFVPPRQLKREVPQALEAVCLKAMAVRPEDRYPTARALAGDVEKWLADEPVSAWREPWRQRAGRWARRHPALVAAVAVGGIVFAAGAVVLALFALEAGQQAERAKKNEDNAVARGKEPATANETLTQTANDLKRSRDDLERTTARSLLRPLALLPRDDLLRGLSGGGAQPMTEPEWVALWELAKDRSGRLGYRFVEEASRGPVSSRQLRDRAASALLAAVGLDAERRGGVEALLMARLDDPTLGDEQKRDLALAASAWDGLGSSAALRTARQLARAMQDPKNVVALDLLEKGLFAGVNRLEARDAAQAAATLIPAMKGTKNQLVLGKLTGGVKAVAPRLEAKDAAQAATALIQTIKDTKDPNAVEDLARCLSAVAPRLEAKDAAQVAAALVQLMKDTKEPQALCALASGLPAVASLLEAKDAVQAAILCVEGRKDTDAVSAFNDLHRGAQGLSALLSGVPPAEIPSRAATAASAVAFPFCTGHPLTALDLVIPAAEPFPCRLSTQQLIELLKMPTCIGGVRRVVLNHLGNRYRHTFGDAWEFVRFAQEQHLDLDFTSPPRRPGLQEGDR
jgi:serine/threonine protein kinase